MDQGIMLPVGPIRKIIIDWMEKYNMLQEEFAFYVGLPPRSIYRLVSGESKHVIWENADQIVTRTIGPLHWHTDDELRELYWNVDLSREDLVNPLDNPAAVAESDRRALEAWDCSETRKEAAEKLGIGPTTYTRVLDPALKRAGRGLGKKSKLNYRKKTHCKNGHEIAVHGRDASGACRICRAEEKRRSYLEMKEAKRA